MRTAEQLLEYGENLINPELEKEFARDRYHLSSDNGSKFERTAEAAHYSLMAGGKRIRPLFMFITASMLKLGDEQMKDVLTFAGSLEMIHTYSLIHDDLPAMDNDDLRRGKPTCHKAFDEATAILAGDMLLNLAYERLFEIAEKNPGYTYAAHKLCELAGYGGMIMGQSIDINGAGAEYAPTVLEQLYLLQRKKTGALIEAAVTTPYNMFCHDSGDGDTAEVGRLLREYADGAGLAFQIRDDILDEISAPEVLGKSVGKDERDDKTTFVTYLGLEGAGEKVKEFEEKALRALNGLEKLGYDVADFRTMTDYLLWRES